MNNGNSNKDKKKVVYSSIQQSNSHKYAKYDEENDRLPSPKDSANLSNYASDQTIVEASLNGSVNMQTFNNLQSNYHINHQNAQSDSGEPTF